MDRITITPGDIRLNYNKELLLLHDATSMVKFASGFSNPIRSGWCIALCFQGFKFGVTIQPLSYPFSSDFQWVQMFELGKSELERFNIPAEFMYTTDEWQDWESPLTKHIVVEHLCPHILVSPTADGNSQSIHVTMSIRNLGSENATISTNQGVLILLHHVC